MPAAILESELVPLELELELQPSKPISDENGAEGEPELILQEEEYPPEGTWGWLIVASAFLANFVVDGISLSYGIMTDEITSKMKPSTKASPYDDHGPTEKPYEEDPDPDSITITQFNTVGSILLAVTLLMGPFASILSEKFGFRRTAMAGSLIATAGIFIPWAASPTKPSFWPFVIGFGVITGIGFGILFTVSVVIVGKYFDKNVAIATGVTVAGTGVGTLTMAPVVNWVLKAKWGGWQGAIIMETILAAVSVFFGLMYRPLPKRTVKRRNSELVRAAAGAMPVKQQLRKLLTSPSYLIVCFSGAFVMMGYFAPFGFLKDSAEVYIAEEKAVFLLSVLGIANAIGRVLFGLLANKIGHSLHISNVALTVGGIVTIFYPFATTHTWLVICSVVFGSYAAVFAALRSVIIKKVVGEKKLNVGFGLSLWFMGVATLFSNSLGGHLKDKTENYDMSFYVAGGFLILSAVICYPLPWVYRWEKARNSKVLMYAGDQHRRSLVDVNVNS